MQKTKNVLNVPNLRFPGFEGEWETKKLGEVCEMQAGKFVSASEIFSKKNDDLFPCYGGNGLRGYTKSFNKIGAYPLIGRQGALCGNITMTEGKFHATEHAIIVTPYDKINTTWLYYLLVHLNLNQYATGMAQPGLSVQNLVKIETIFPKTKFEQEKISSFLSLIDNRIQTQNKIIKELIVLKSATAKKIFSQKLRFKDENGNDYSKWELKELAEVMSIPEKIKATTIDKNKLLTVKLHLKGVLKNENTDTLSLGATNYFIRKKGQFIYGKQNLFNGAFDIIPDEFDGFLSSGDVPTLDINHSKIIASYLLYFLGREEFYTRLEDIASGSGSKRIHENTLLAIKINLPSVPEQIKIANCLSSIDAKIEIETQLSEKLEEQKKFLLQQMFV